jgi:hypothetical protein
VYEKDRKNGAGLITPAKVSSIMVLSYYSKDASQQLVTRANNVDFFSYPGKNLRIIFVRIVEPC